MTRGDLENAGARAKPSLYSRRFRDRSSRELFERSTNVPESSFAPVAEDGAMLKRAASKPVTVSESKMELLWPPADVFRPAAQQNKGVVV